MADDPFFADEDDGDFDDLYGKPAPAPSPPRKRNVKRHDYSDDDDYLRSPASSSRASPPPKSRTTFADTPSDWSSSQQQQQPRPSASVASSRGGGGSAGKKARGRDKKVRRKGSQELFDAEWENEAHVSACSICASGFSLVRRKHHCRPCGRVMCSDCSSFLFFEASQRKHRVCSACAADHSAAIRAASQSQRNALFDNASDAEPERTSVAIRTPSSVASDTRGGFRTSVLHAITPKSNKRDKRKEKKEKRKDRAASNDQQMSTPVADVANAHSGSEVSAAEARGQGTGPGLFNTAGDTWFTEPADEDEGDRKQTSSSGMGRAFPNADYSDGFADSTNSNSHTAADEWRDQVKASYELRLDPASRAGVAAPSGFGFGRKDFSEQYHYDDEPLEYEDDVKISPGYKEASSIRPSMPRPDPVVTFESEPKAKMENRRRRPPAEEQASEHLRQSTLKVNLKGLFHGKSKKEKREQRWKSKESRAGRRASQRSEETSPVAAGSGPRTSLGQRMTLDELEITPKPLNFEASAMRPTFYDDDADELVVDDTPGYFEANLAKTSADQRKQEELERKLAEDAAWVNGAAAPAQTGNRFSSGHESFSIVDAPSHGTSSPESAANNTSSSKLDPHDEDKGKEHGFTGALKRFFGMSTAKTPEKGSIISTEGPKPVRAVDLPGPIVTPAQISQAMASRKSIADDYKLDADDRTLSFRHSLGDIAQMSEYERHDGQDVAALRDTMAGNLDAQNSIRTGTFMVPETLPVSHHREPKRKKSSKSLKRRDTFDGLFESPKAVDRRNEASSGLPTRSWGEVAIENTRAFSVGVSRFDAYRDDRQDEADDFMPDNHGSRARTSDAYRDSPRDARYNSAPDLKPRRDSDDAFGSPTKPTSAFTWNSVQAAPGFGTASYAVPAGAPFRDSRFGGDRFASNRADSDDGGAESPHNIMQDLHRRSMSADARRKRSTANSVDDIFAQFERPDDYVFDPATGSYVTARPVPRATRRAKEASTETQRSYEPNVVAETRSSVGRQSSERVRSETLYDTKPIDPRPVDRSGEDSDSNGSDDVIVDKISSLEGELAALKRLIKKRKGGVPKTDVSRSASSKSKPRLLSHVSAKPRKESIFDGGSSESDKEMSRWPAPSTRKQKEAKTKPQPRKAPRDSFESLFDDDPQEDSGIAGGGGYDALFQTGSSKSDESDGDEKDVSRSPTVRRSGKRKPSKKFATKDADSNKTRALDDSDAQDEDETELASLKNKRTVARRRRSSKERTAPGWADDSPDEAAVTASSVTEPVPEVNAKSTAQASSSASKASAVEEEDPIDALFDTSNDADMTDLYGGETASTEGRAKDDPSDKTPARQAYSRNPKTRRRLSDGDGDEDNADAAPVIAPVTLESSTKISLSPSSFVMSGGAMTPLTVSTSDGSDADSEEEFSINWKKVKSGRARRQTRPLAAIPAQVSFVSITGTDLMDGGEEEATATAEPTLKVDSMSTSPDASDDADVDSDEHPVPADDCASGPVIAVDVNGTDALRADDEDPEVTAPTAVLDADSVSVSDITEVSEEDRVDQSGDPPVSTESFDAVESAHVDAESPMTPSTLSSFTRSRVGDDLFLGDDGDGDGSMGLFDRSNDVDLHSLMGGGASTLYDDFSTPGTRSAPPSSSLLGEKDDGDASSSGEENGEDAGSSFEIQPQRRKTPKPFTVETVVPRSSSIASASIADDDDQDSVLLGKYTRAPPSQVEVAALAVSDQLSGSVSSVDSSNGADAADNGVDTSLTVAEDDASSPRMSAGSADAFDADWQAMQEQEKQRKKKLQMKQRQAQRDKLMFKKQHSKMLASSANDGAAGNKSGKKQKKKKSSKDDGALSTRKHRHREKEAAADRGGNEPEAAANDASGSLTEL